MSAGVLRGFDGPTQLDNLGDPTKAVGKAPAVALIDPRYGHNVGNALRACACFGIEQLWWTGNRVQLDSWKGERLPREERMKGYKNVQMFNYDRFFDKFKDVTPVAVELRPGTESLIEFEHPENPLYIFGPEDGSIPRHLNNLCHRLLVIPSHNCLNLAAAVNVVLYDRRAKRVRAGLEENLSIGELLKEHRGPILSNS
jgi:tRNA(Leu) C34 or U34 (ribose-2'-O)-methylase TrmL